MQYLHERCRIKATGSTELRIAATTLDDVWYPLIVGDSKAKAQVAFGSGAAAKSDKTAAYKLVPRASEVGPIRFENLLLEEIAPNASN